MTSFARNCNILLILSIFKCIRQNEWQVYYFLIISIQFLIISTTPTSSKEEESDELLYTGSVTRYQKFYVYNQSPVPIRSFWPTAWLSDRRNINACDSRDRCEEHRCWSRESYCEDPHQVDTTENPIVECRISWKT